MIHSLAEGNIGISGTILGPIHVYYQILLKMIVVDKTCCIAEKEKLGYYYLSSPVAK
jgi:hypothetical protein